MLEVRGAHPDEIDAAIACCGAAFGGDDPDRVARMTSFFAKIHTHDPWFDPANTRIAVLDGRIVSVVQLFDRQMLIGGTPIRLGGIGSVGTRPDCRGRGYNTLVLQDIVAYMEALGYDLSLLFTGINDYYARLGWRTFEHAARLRVSLLDPLPRIPFEGTIRPMDWDRDLDRVMSIHAEFNRSATGPTVRSREFWEAHRSWRGFDAAQFPVAVVNGEVVAYRSDNGADSIGELGFRSGAKEAAIALVFDFLRKAQNAGKERATIGRFSFRRELEAFGLNVQIEPSHGFMFRLIDLRSLIGKLSASMRQRWAESTVVSWTGYVSIECETGRVALRAADGTLSICDAPEHDAPGIRLRLTDADVIDLLLGQAQHARLLENDAGTGVAPTTALEILTTLFPRREYRWYDRDGF